MFKTVIEMEKHRVKNLYIVESPFQLLSAIEASNYFKKDYSILILKYTGNSSRENDLQLVKILDEFNNFDEVIKIQPFSGSLFEANFRLLVMLKIFQIKKTQFAKIFIGEFRSWYHRAFINVLPSDENFLLDDGNVIIELQKRNVSIEEYISIDTFSESKALKNTLRQIYFKTMSWLLNSKEKSQAIEKTHLFTFFDLEPRNHSQRIIKNSFSYFKRKKVKNSIDQSLIYFFGGNLSELNILPREFELVLLKKVIRYYQNKNKKVVYIPHRREKKEKLDLMKQKFNIDILSFSYPAELQFLFMDIHPFGIASFISTALFTVSKIFDFSIVDAFYLPMEQIPESVRQEYSSIYDEYKKTINVIYLNELD